MTRAVSHGVERPMGAFSGIGVGEGRGLGCDTGALKAGPWDNGASYYADG